MPNFYEILEHIEKRPAMYLDSCGLGYGIHSLDMFCMGFRMAGGKTYVESSGYPDFLLFTEWLIGCLDYEFARSSAGWAYHLVQQHGDTKEALGSFFEHLKKFKSTVPEVRIVPINHSSIKKPTGPSLWIREGIDTPEYDSKLARIDHLVLYKLAPSRTLFCLMADKDGAVLDGRNDDISGQELPGIIQEQFGIDIEEIPILGREEGERVLRKHKVK